MLAVAAALLVALATLFLKDNNLLVFLIFENGGLYAGPFDQGCAEACVSTLTDHEDIVNVNGISGSSAGK